MNEPPLLCRPILPREVAWITEAQAINNAVWGNHLASSVEGFRHRATRGFLVGAFSNDGLEGTISGVELPAAELARAEEPDAPLGTWDRATGGGAFSTAVPGGDALCIVAVTSRGAVRPVRSTFDTSCEGLRGEYGEWARILANLEAVSALPEALADAAHGLLGAYMDANLDPVLRFHARNKGPLGGATPWRTVRGGRTRDVEALGYTALLRYPELTREARSLLFTTTRYVPGSVGEALVLAAANLACTLPAVRWVIPYSRPAGYRRHLGNLFARLAGAELPILRMEEQTFFEAAKRVL
jgi:hypothetical protein